MSESKPRIGAVTGVTPKEGRELSECERIAERVDKLDRVVFGSAKDGKDGLETDVSALKQQTSDNYTALKRLEDDTAAALYVIDERVDHHDRILQGQEVDGVVRKGVAQLVRESAEATHSMNAILQLSEGRRADYMRIGRIIALGVIGLILIQGAMVLRDWLNSL